MGLRVRSRSNTRLVVFEAVTACNMGSDFFFCKIGRNFMMLLSP